MSNSINQRPLQITGLPWDEQLDDETDRQYMFWRYYLSLPRSKRTYQAVADRFQVKQSSVTFVSKRNRWVERIQLFDLEQGELKAAQQAETLESAITALTARGVALQELALEQLKSAKKFTPTELLKILEVGVRIQREALGLSNDPQAPSVNVNTNIDASSTTQVAIGLPAAIERYAEVMRQIVEAQPLSIAGETLDDTAE